MCSGDGHPELVAAAGFACARRPTKGEDVIFKSVLLGTRPASRCPVDARRRKGHGAQARAGLRLSSLLMTRDAVLAGAALLAKLHVADDIAAGRLAYRGSHADPAGGNLDAPKFAPPHQLQGPRFPGFVGGFSGEELRIADMIRPLPTARISLHQLRWIKIHKLRLSVSPCSASVTGFGLSAHSPSLYGTPWPRSA
jgi:hypothetical protein